MIVKEGSPFSPEWNVSDKEGTIEDIKHFGFRTGLNDKYSIKYGKPVNFEDFYLTLSGTETEEEAQDKFENYVNGVFSESTRKTEDSAEVVNGKLKVLGADKTGPQRHQIDQRKINAFMHFLTAHAKDKTSEYNQLANDLLAKISVEDYGTHDIVSQLSPNDKGYGKLIITTDAGKGQTPEVYEVNFSADGNVLPPITRKQ